MKILIALSVLLIATVANAADLKGMTEKQCQGLGLFNHNLTALCTDADDVGYILTVSRDNDHALEKLPAIVEFKDAIVLKVLPLAGTTMTDFHPFELKNDKGTTVGYVVSHSYENSVSNEKLDLESRFNSKGKLVSVEIQ